MVFGDFGQAADLLPPGGVRLGVVQMPGIVADLVDVGGGLFGETVVLLQVDRKADVRLPAYFGEGPDVPLGIDRQTDDRRARLFEAVDRLDRGVDVGRFAGRHRLNGNRVPPADHDGSDAD